MGGFLKSGFFSLVCCSWWLWNILWLWNPSLLWLLILNLGFNCFSIWKVKSKTISSSSKTTTKTTTTTTTATAKVREKKVFNLPGQKYDPPEEVCAFLLLDSLCSLYDWWTQHSCSFVCCEQREPLRIFYESLSKQIPASEMAEFWCGLFSDFLLSIHCLFNPSRTSWTRNTELRLLWMYYVLINLVSYMTPRLMIIWVSFNGNQFPIVRQNVFLSST